ncbi:TIGR04104 family putative zinc finger protein [Oceanobacillus saliphilus]|uniref:TIGR04104 family putative zinc finger protein n=1 Tax=Oceanobacillus saliphilus TaxID=2925834 RepID=UPI00201E158D|nr:TIGR04104 family putative zinc finger protein [Oceanobacillus saliphilus]
METPTCGYCKKQWSYFATLKNLFRLKMNCPHCGKENYYESTRNKGVLTLITAPAVIIVGAFLDFPSGWLIGIALILVLVHFLLFPFRTKVKKAN